VHTGVTRLGVASAITTAAVVLSASPVIAEENGRINPPTNDEYSHAAEWVAAAGGGRGSSGPATCELPYESTRDRPAHYEWHSYPNSGGTYAVFLDCVLDGTSWEPGELGSVPGDEWDVVWYRMNVEPRDPEELAADALARLRPPEAGIHTDPGDGQASLVGMETWLWLDEDTYGYQEVWEYDGPEVGGQPLLAVKVWAEPKPGGSVVWHTADGSTTCPNGGTPPGSCTYEFNRSSARQPFADSASQPAYEVTASYSYTGGYEVWVMGDQIDRGTLDDIPRTSMTYLAVAEAQAINTEG
jgi:hypothetical protein